MAGDLIVTEESKWIRYSGPGLMLQETSDYITMSYGDQSATFRVDDITTRPGEAWLRKGAVPLSINGEEVPQVSAEGGSEACRCSQCVLFLEYCCNPYTDYVGVCFGAWGCRGSCG